MNNLNPAGTSYSEHTAENLNGAVQSSETEREDAINFTRKRQEIKREVCKRYLSEIDSMNLSSFIERLKYLVPLNIRQIEIACSAWSARADQNKVDDQTADKIYKLVETQEEMRLCFKLIKIEAECKLEASI
jgi:hypothetical protein